MPSPFVTLRPLPDAEVDQVTGSSVVEPLEAEYPERETEKRAAARAALEEWQKSVTPPPSVQNPEFAIRAVPPSRAQLAKLRRVRDGGLDPRVMGQEGMRPDELFATLFSGLATYEFMKLEAEYHKRKARGGRTLAATERRWKEIVSEFSRAFATAGLANLGEAELHRYVEELNADKENRDAIIEIANSGEGVADPEDIDGVVVPTAAFVAVTDLVLDRLPPITIPIPDLCDEPFAEGVFTKHFSHEIALSVTIKYLCGISWSGLKWCTKKVTLAGVSFKFGIKVGYKVNCCGATVWGQGGAQVCATIAGSHVCAECTATVIGVAGVSRTPVSRNQCEYGLGINARLVCRLAGATILDMSYPFGWTVSGPCPPAGLCA